MCRTLFEKTVQRGVHAYGHVACRYFSEGAACIKEKNTRFKAKFDELVNAMDMVGFSDEVRLQ